MGKTGAAKCQVVDWRRNCYGDLWNCIWERILPYIKCFWNKGLELLGGKYVSYANVFVGAGGGGLSGSDLGYALSGTFACDGVSLSDLRPGEKFYYDIDIQYFCLCIATVFVSERGEGFEVCAA